MSRPEHGANVLLAEPSKVTDLESDEMSSQKLLQDAHVYTFILIFLRQAPVRELGRIVEELSLAAGESIICEFETGVVSN